MIEKVIDTINKYNMIDKGDKVIVGISGGPDSVALLHIFNKISIKYDIKIIAAHVNHNLRGRESDEDQEYVESICNSFNIPIYVECIDINEIAKSRKVSLEVAGREARYNFFKKIMQRENAQKVAVAHNENDNAETILMRMIRGTGLEGLTGIKPVRDEVVRPLIEISRNEIEHYCETNNLDPRIDSSNHEKIFTRNKIRLELMPYIEREFNPNIIQTLNRMGNLIDVENSYIDTQAKKIFAEIVLEKTMEYIALNLDTISKQDILIISRVLRFAIKELIGSLVDFEQKNIIDSIEFIMNSKTGSIFDLPKGVKLKKSYNTLYILKNFRPKDIKKYSYNINIAATTRVLETGHSLECEIKNISDIDIKTDRFTQFFDFDKIGGNLELRTRKNGDIFSPSGMKGKKKLKDFYIDEKIPKDERDEIPLVAKNNEIVWIIGKRISEKYKVDNKTKNVLVMKYIMS